MFRSFVVSCVFDTKIKHVCLVEADRTKGSSKSGWVVHGLETLRPSVRGSTAIRADPSFGGSVQTIRETSVVTSLLDSPRSARLESEFATAGRAQVDGDAMNEG